jgi:hypothetical protein
VFGGVNRTHRAIGDVSQNSITRSRDYLAGRQQHAHSEIRSEGPWQKAITDSVESGVHIAKDIGRTPDAEKPTTLSSHGLLQLN